MNTVFFVIPVYKVEKYLNRCVDSVMKQTYKNIRVILVDDGSPDNCGRICDEYAIKYANVSVIHKENGGLSDARNKGLEIVLSQGDKEDYVIFLDSDDFIKETFAEKLLGLCQRYDAQIAQCAYEKGSKDEFSVQKGKAGVVCVDSKQAILGYRLKSQCTPKLYKLCIFDDIRFTVGVWNEDEFFTYKAVYKSERVAFTDEKLFYYYQHHGSIMSDIVNKLKDNPHKWDWLEAYKERIEFFEKMGEPEQVMKTHEKICTDIILRYCEQMYLEKNERDSSVADGKYLSLYHKSYDIMKKRKGMPVKRRMMYFAFKICPYSAVLMGKVFTLRK